MRIGGRSGRRLVKRQLRRAEIALVRQPRLTEPDRGSWRERLERLLSENVLPFWRSRAIDPVGGYHEEYGEQPSATRHARTQARMLWFFSRLLRSPYRADMDLRAAQHGLRFVIDHLWDSERGGVYSEASGSGRPTELKHLYDQVMALDALAEFSHATADRRARSLAEDTVNAILTLYRDDADGYWESLTLDWKLPRAIRGAGLLVDDPTHKTTATHINLLNALTNAHLAEIADLTSPIRSLLEILDVRAVAPGSTMMGEVFQRDWSATVGPPSVSYGHDIERIWMARAARSAIGDPPTDHAPLFAEIVRWGWDRRNGGFYFAGTPGRPAVNLKKQWWVQAEALVACGVLRNNHATVDGVFEGTLRWIESVQADGDGEWHDTVLVDGSTSGPKAWEWKTGYHTTRSLLKALEGLTL